MWKILTVCVLEAIAPTAVVIVLSCGDADADVLICGAAVAAYFELHKLPYEKKD